MNVSKNIPSCHANKENGNGGRLAMLRELEINFIFLKEPTPKIQAPNTASTPNPHDKPKYNSLGEKIARVTPPKKILSASAVDNENLDCMRYYYCVPPVVDAGG